MSIRKINIEKISKNDLEKLLQSIYKRYNCDNFSKVFDSYFILKIEGEKFSQIAYTNSDFSQIIDKLNNINLFPYFIGIPILKITGKNKIVPLLPLGDIMKDFCKNKIYLPSSLAMKIIYGHKIEVKESYSFKYGIIILDDKFIAYVKTLRSKNKTLIIPDLDIGWYLRKAG
ncbi:hypothetical protein DFR86_06375 [Acidianus sulfidivorans JP7]|uniref:Uncharacterized protein n=1 Tax=Acidianus sulfidivorans JP7 TaxID=619593 RepID=A0A2U9IMH7_9CREN|nr:hypothetical protein [Acidianus sulfidivorans]AWR97222.1 hypothetical protein DFR86_06375 [Acidianus sulfidivorans JP7]